MVKVESTACSLAGTASTPVSIVVCGASTTFVVVMELGLEVEVITTVCSTIARMEVVLPWLSVVGIKDVYSVVVENA